MIDWLNQHDYIAGIEEISLSNASDSTRLLDKKEQREYRRACGALNWVATQSRPDISFDVAVLSSKLGQPNVKDVKMANKVVRKVKSADISLRFLKLHGPLRICAYSDASHANLPDGGSQGGQIVFLKDELGQMSPISWVSRKVRRVCRSTKSAETLSMLDAIDTSIWLSHILSELLGYTKVITVITDNEGLKDSAYSTTAVEEKRLRVEIASIRETIRDRLVKVEWVLKVDQLADVLTKQGASRDRLLAVLAQSKVM